MENPVAALDEWPIMKGIGKKCFKCGRAFEPGDKVLVSPRETTDGVEAVFGECVDCGDKEIPDRDREKGHDQYHLKFNIKPAPGGLVLDGEEGKVLDHSPPEEGN